MLAAGSSRLTAIQQQITAHLHAHAELHEQHDLMDAVAGIGPVTAQKLVAEFDDLASYTSAKAVGADAGLTPATFGDLLAPHSHPFRVSTKDRGEGQRRYRFGACTRIRCVSAE